MSSASTAHSMNMSQKTSDEMFLNDDPAITSPKSHSPVKRKILRDPKFLPRWSVIIMSIAFAIGSGNVWIFPILTIKHGGIIFLAQYTLCVVFVAVPVLYMEMAIAQFCSRSTFFIFRNMVPICGGMVSSIAYALVMRTLTLSVWTTYSLTFAGMSLRGIFEEPYWESCKHQENTCYDPSLAITCTTAFSNDTSCNQFQHSLINTRGTLTRRTPFVHFMSKTIIKMATVPSELEFPHWAVLLVLLFVYASAGGLSYFGSKLLKYTSWFTVVFCFLVYLTLFVVSTQLPLATEVFSYLSKVEVEDLKDLEAWTDAAAQAIFTLNLGCGGILQISSLRPFSQKHKRDILVITSASYIFQMLLSFAAIVFATYYANFLYPNQEVQRRMAEMWSDDSFIQSVFPEVLSSHSGGWVLTFFYFLADFLLGIHTMIFYFWILISIFKDHHCYFHGITSLNVRFYTLLFIGLVLGGFFISFFFTLPNGLLLLYVVDQYTSYITLLIVLMEIITISYLYGFRRLIVNIRTMSQDTQIIHFYWWTNWIVLSPLLITSSILLAFVNFFVCTVPLPKRILVTLTILTFSSVAFVVFYAIMYNRKKKTRVGSSMRMLDPTMEWRPLLEQDAMDACKMERALRIR